MLLSSLGPSFVRRNHEVYSLPWPGLAWWILSQSCGFQQQLKLMEECSLGFQFHLTKELGLVLGKPLPILGEVHASFKWVKSMLAS